ncbi:unnamed protein product [Owenia fusiformis]|uniref:Acylglycerol kinase, mitochondrial n=1 Tax=Owenia fusiformis TaxID=6347 RepID=A0A8J1TEK3_OWEFU|nr:unnamed protein product [Owenia fusiformis]
MVLKILTTLRNNPKKSIFFAAVAAYGVKYLKGKYDDNQTRTAYCLEAKQYGEQLNGPAGRPRKVTVFLNPVANDRDGKSAFEKDAVPLLHLAGLEVNIIRTESVGQAKKYMGVIETEDTDAIIVAGGDGTVSEIVTGLLRRENQDIVKKVPIGIIPIGKSNSLAKLIFTDNQDKVKWLCETALAIIKGVTKPVDVLRIEGEGDRMVYAVAGMEWSPYRHAEVRAKKYWYFGPLKHRWSHIMQTFHDWSTLNAKLEYQYPCDGCSTCFTPPPKVVWKWWHMFVPPAQPKAPAKDYSSIVNEKCGVKHQQEVKTVDFGVLSSNYRNQESEEDRCITVSIGPSDLSRTEFVKYGWDRIGKERCDQIRTSKDKLKVGQFQLIPADAHTNTTTDAKDPDVNDKDGDEKENAVDDYKPVFHIDNEEFEVMPITVTLLKDKVNVFCPESKNKVAT